MIFEIALLCSSAISSQLLHYRFIEKKRAHVEIVDAFNKLQEELKLIHELKAKVEGLALRAGLSR